MHWITKDQFQPLSLKRLLQSFLSSDFRKNFCQFNWRLILLIGFLLIAQMGFSQTTITDGGAFNALVSASSTNQPIGRFSLKTTDTGGLLTSLAIKLNGARTGLTNLKLWESSDNVFRTTTATQLGSTVASDPGNGASVTFNGFNSAILTVDKYYFVTSDIASSPSGSIQAVIASNSSLTFSGTTISGTITNAPLSSSSVGFALNHILGLGQKKLFDANASTQSWTIPDGTTNIQVICIGGGGSGGAGYWAGGGGGGGALAYRLNWQVTAGQSCTILAGLGGTGISVNAGGTGTNGTDSYLTYNGVTITAGGGKAGYGGGGSGYAGGSGGTQSGTSDGGGSGGTGASGVSDTAGGGAGAGGYSGNGGNGGWNAGAGGGGAGGINGGSNASAGATQSGGGTGIDGPGVSGTSSGKGGSGGGDGSPNLTVGGVGNTGGLYGGGGGGQSNDANSTPGCDGGAGAVAIYYGWTKSYSDGSFALSAKAVSGATVTYASSDPSVATISGSTVNIVGGGTCKIYAMANGSSYLPTSQTLTVSSAQPTLSTTAVSSITAASASSGGSITDAGGSAVTARGICWSTSPSPTITNSKTTDGSGIGSFISSITGLTSNTTYYVRAYATNSIGTGYGNQITFVTSALPPTITSFAPTTCTIGQSVVITGTYLTGATAVKINGTDVSSFIVNSATQITAVVGNSTTSGTVSVTTPGGTVTSGSILTVNKIDQTITFGALTAKTYGDAAFNLNATGGASGNSVTYASSNTAVATVSGNTVTIVGAGTTNITASQSGNANYNAAINVVQSLTVNKKALTITSVTASNKTYDGGNTATLSGGTLNGIVGSDVVTIITGTGTFNNANAGTGKTVTATEYALDGTNSSNYTLSGQPLGITANITARSLTITADNKTKEYDGTTFSQFTVTYNGFVNGEDKIVLSGSLTFSGTATTATNAGNSYLITPGGLTSGNYSISYVDGWLDITKKTLTITAENKTKEYDGLGYSAFTVTYNGFANGEDKAVLSGTLSFSGTAKTATNVGTGYVITPGGLTSGNYSISYVNGTLDITKKALTITADNKTKVYDGSVFSPFTVTYNGFANGEDKAVLSGTLSFSGTAATASNVGTGYVITPGGLTSGNYSISYVNGTLDITKKSLTITADNKTKVYDGLVFSPFTVTYNGFANGEDKAVLSGTLSYSGTAATASNVGAGYVITPGGLTSGNYSISFVNGTLDITKKALTITADNKTKVYDGLVYSTFTVTYNGFANGEDKAVLSGTLSFSGTAATASNVGAGYVIAPGGLTSGNYSISYVNGTLDITKKALTITADNKTKVYDGLVFSPFTVTYNGFANGEDKNVLTGTLSYSGTATTETNADVGYVITPGGLTSGNYSIIFVNGSLDITKKALTITADNKTKVYDGIVFSPFTVTYNGFANGEDKTVLSGTLSYSGTATTATNAGVSYVITPDGLTSGNYSISYFNGSLDITKKALAITANNKTKVYDGLVFSPFTVTYNGFANGEDKAVLSGTLSYSGTAITASNAGNGYVITPGGLTSGNYSISFVNGTLDITKKSLIITADNKTKEYDGSVYSSFTVTYNGFVDGEDKNVLSGALSYSGTAIGATNIGSGYVISPSGFTSGNYAISYINGTLDITKKVLTITAENKTKEYDGLGYSAFTVTYNGFVDGEDQTILSGTLSFSGTAKTAINGGTGYVITPGGLTSVNYTINFVNGTLDIAKKELTITADNKTKVYDGFVYSPFTVTYNGFVNGEDKTVLSGTLSYSGTAAIVTNVGTGYVIIPGGLTSGNYSISYVNGSLDITKKALTITADNKTKVYDGLVFSPFTVTYNGFANGEDKAALSGTLSFSGTAATASNVGTGYVITPGGLTSGNYSISYVNGTLDITKKSLTITADNKTKVYDGLVFSPFTVTYNGFANGEDKNVLTGTLSYSSTATTATNAGIGYVITPGGLTSGNYSISFVNGTLDITKKSQAITFNALATKVYGDVLFNLTGTSSSGFVVSYSTSNTNVAAVLGNTVTIIGAGTTTITASQPGNSNFSPASNVTQLLTVSKAEQVLTLDQLPVGALPLKDFTDPIPVTASSSSGLPVIISLGEGSAASLNGNQLENIGTTGNVIVKIDQPGNLNYNPASISYNFDVVKSNQSISFQALTKTTYLAGLTIDLSNEATASSNLNVSYSVESGAATINGTTLTVTGAGIIAIKASQDGNAAWNPATDVVRLLTVEKATPVVTNFGNLSKIYGDDIFTLNATSESTGLFVYSSSNTDVATILGNTVTIVGSGTSVLSAIQDFDGNYTAASATATLTVGLNGQSITFNTLNDKTYGDDNFELTATASSELAVIYSSSNTDVATITGNTVTIVGAGTTIITANQSGDVNFIAAEKVEQPLFIAAKELSVIGALAKNKVYDGKTEAAIESAALSGVVAGDIVVLDNASVGTFSQSLVGLSIPVTTAMTISGDDAKNYTLTQPVGLIADITTASLIITADNKSKEYDGLVYSPFAVSYNGFVDGEDLTVLSGTLSFNGTGTIATNAGTDYVISPEGLTSDNYTITFEDGKLDITKKALTITAENKSEEYDGLRFNSFTVTYDGFITGEDKTVLQGTLSFSGTATDATDAGSGYVITPGGLTSGNYDVNYTNGSLSIRKRVLTIAAENKTKKYDGLVYSPFTVQYNGFVNGQNSAFLSGKLTFSGTAVTATDARPGYVITPGGLSSDNYWINYIDGKLDIEQNDQIITFDPIPGKVFGDVDFELKATASSGLPVIFTSSDESVVACSGSIAIIKGVGSCTIYANQPGNENYNAALNVEQIITVSRFISGDLNHDGEITYPEIAGDTDGNGKIDNGEVAGDADGDGKITSPEKLGDTNGDGSINGTEIAGDSNGDGNIGDGETAGNTGNGGSTIAGDLNGDGKIDGDELAGDADGDGKITSPEVTGDTNGDGKIDNGEVAGDTNGDGTIGGNEVSGDSNGDGQVTEGETSQTIVFLPLDNKYLGDEPFVVSATGGYSGNPVTFTSSDITVATCSGTNGEIITVVGAGTCIITANQAGNAIFSAASDVLQTLKVDFKVGIEDNSIEDKLIAYSVRNIEIRIKGEVSRGTVATLYDLSGRVVRTETLEEVDLNIMPIPGLKTSIYVLSVNDHGKIQTFKIPVKE